MKKYFWDYVFLLSIAGIVILLDQWSKYLIRTNLAVGEIWSPWAWLTPYARFIHWLNSGAAFGLGQELGNVFKILAFIVAGAILYYYPQIPRSDWLPRISLGLMLGGAVGNLIDRLLFDGYVTDFISVGRFAVFNVADASISVGVVVLIVGMWLQERKLKAANSSTQNQAETEQPISPAEMQSE